MRTRATGLSVIVLQARCSAITWPTSLRTTLRTALGPAGLRTTGLRTTGLGTAGLGTTGLGTGLRSTGVRGACLRTAALCRPNVRSTTLPRTGTLLRCLALLRCRALLRSGALLGSALGRLRRAAIGRCRLPRTHWPRTGLARTGLVRTSLGGTSLAGTGLVRTGLWGAGLLRPGLPGRVLVGVFGLTVGPTVTEPVVRRPLVLGRVGVLELALGVCGLAPPRGRLAIPGRLLRRTGRLVAVSRFAPRGWIPVVRHRYSSRPSGCSRQRGASGAVRGADAAPGRASPRTDCSPPDILCVIRTHQASQRGQSPSATRCSVIETTMTL
ncbi:hypothetical protein EV652_103278 [Kribbella steppae]|uniref:Pentapeptide repeat protein n=1 Tax=Kribbella steppae TaxID=2512223 RepID=A0A4R2HQM7_9ACTN|nr:hypothetical protein EV652_103278 [Kribbella steppae]